MGDKSTAKARKSGPEVYQLSNGRISLLRQWLNYPVFTLQAVCQYCSVGNIRLLLVLLSELPNSLHTFGNYCSWFKAGRTPIRKTSWVAFPFDFGTLRHPAPLRDEWVGHSSRSTRDSPNIPRSANSTQSLWLTPARNSARRSYHTVWSLSVKWALAGLGFGTT